MKKLLLDVILLNILLLIREIFVSVISKNIIINLFLLLPLFIFSIKFHHHTLLGAIISIFATINIIETYKSIEKEKNWQKIRCFYYLLYFEQLSYIIEKLKNITFTKLDMLSVDGQGRPYIAIGKDTDEKINKITYDLDKYIEDRSKDINFFHFFNNTKKYFVRIIRDAISNIEHYSTRKEILDKVLEAKEFIILLNQISDNEKSQISQNEIKQLITFLKISNQLLNAIKSDLFLYRYKHVRIGQNLLIEGSNKEGAWEFGSIEYILNDFWQETLFKACRWC